MTIDSTENKNLIIDQQNKLIDFLYKEQAQHVEQINEKQEQLDTIFKEIAKLYDYIDENRDLLEVDYIFEKLADIQNYCK